MHEPDRILDADGRPLDGESVAQPTLDAAPPQVPDAEPVEAEAAPAPAGRRRFRAGVLLNGQMAIKLAVVLSFVILLVTMVVQRFRSPKSAAMGVTVAARDSRTPPTQAIPRQKPPDTETPPSPTPIPDAVAVAVDPSTVPVHDPAAVNAPSPTPLVVVTPESPPSPSPSPSPVPQTSTEPMPAAPDLLAESDVSSPSPIEGAPAAPPVLPTLTTPPASAAPTLVTTAPAPAPAATPPAIDSGSTALPGEDLLAAAPPTPPANSPQGSSAPHDATPPAAAPVVETPAPASEPKAQAPAPPDPETKTAAGSAAMAGFPSDAVPRKDDAAWIPLPSVRPRRDRVAAPAESLAADPAADAQAEADDAPAPAAAPRKRADAAPAVRHIVQPGEDYESIAADFYSSARFGKALQAANRGRPATTGATIIVPMVEALDPAAIPPVEGGAEVADGSGDDPPETSRGRTRGASRARRPAAMLAVGAKSEEPIRLDGEPARRPVHVVRPGETLRSIARDTLRDPHREAEILDLNRRKIPDGARLPEGLRLALPYDAETDRRLR